jgi:hypothetical protein
MLQEFLNSLIIYTVLFGCALMTADFSLRLISGFIEARRAYKANHGQLNFLCQQYTLSAESPPKIEVELTSTIPSPDSSLDNTGISASLDKHCDLACCLEDCPEASLQGQAYPLTSSWKLLKSSSKVPKAAKSLDELTVTKLRKLCQQNHLSIRDNGRILRKEELIQKLSA